MGGALQLAPGRAPGLMAYPVPRHAPCSGAARHFNELVKFTQWEMRKERSTDWQSWATGRNTERPGERAHFRATSERAHRELKADGCRQRKGTNVHREGRTAIRPTAAIFGRDVC